MSGAARKQRRGLVNAILFISSLVLAFGLAEGVLRLFFQERFLIYQEERALLYRYDPKLGWFPRKNSSDTYAGSRTITVEHNSRGFRDQEHHKSDKPGILFIGDSFVWGYDVNASERFTEKLRARMLDWDVYNLGVSGYGTDQELLLLMDQFDYYRPRIVFLVFCTYNDDMDNSSNNIGQGAYYKPYFDVSQNMQLKGIPVPKSLSYFGSQYPWLANSYVVRLLVQAFAPPLVTVANPTASIIHRLKDFVVERNSILVVGLEQPHYALEYILRAEGIPYVQLNGAERFPANGWHWTPEGHTAVSDVIYAFLHKQGVLKPDKENRH